MRINNMKFTTLFALAMVSLAYFSATCEECLEKDIEPQCGTNGVSYLNKCQRKNCAEDVDLAYEGLCRCDCESRPIVEVCGADGLVYRNQCALECAGVPRGYNCRNRGGL